MSTPSTDYEKTWLGWKAGKISDGEIIARMHVDPFFKRWFEDRRQAMFDDQPGHGRAGRDGQQSRAG